MAEEHIARILKMLEEGKVTAAEAESLISALDARKAGAPATGPAAEPPPSPGPPPQEEPGASTASQPGSGETSKSYEFRWSRKSGLPLDVAGLGKQISDAVKSMNPEKMVREATASVAREGRRLRDRMKSWSAWTDEDGAPENTLHQPTAHATDEIPLALAPDGAVHVENHYGDVTITAGPGSAVIRVQKEAWAPTQAEAEALLSELRVVTTGFPAGDVAAGAQGSEATPSDAGAARLEARVVGREGWRDGLVHLHVTVPDGASVTVATGFGDVRVENVGGRVEARTMSGEIMLNGIRSEVRAESIAGDLHATETSGSLSLTTRDGNVRVRSARRGVSANTVRGEIDITDAEGGRVDARSASGDVTVRGAGALAPIDLSLESVSGDISLLDGNGNVTAKTTSGDVSATRVQAATLHAQSVSGDLALRLAGAFNGTLNATTVSGDVDVRVPDGSNCRFALDTHTGALRCDLPAVNTVHTGRMWAGTVGTGAGMLTVQTVSGDIRLADRGES